MRSFNDFTLRQLGAYDMICSCVYNSLSNKDFSLEKDGLNLVKDKFVNRKDYKKLPIYLFRMQDPYWSKNISDTDYWNIINKVENTIFPIILEYAKNNNIKEDEAVIKMIEDNSECIKSLM